MEQISDLQKNLLNDVESADTLEALEALRISVLGKKGQITGLLKTLGSMTPEQRKESGPLLNQLKNRIIDAVTVKKDTLEKAGLDARLKKERVDATLPVRPQTQGTIHPVSQVMDELAEIFADLGFAIAEGPDIENNFHNFTALNIPEEHPARQMHDTFYLAEKEESARKVLRTHTSPVQIRTMINQKPPIRIVAPGRTYRSDSDATHTPMFHQVEGLVLDRDIHMGHLKGCLEAFVTAFFEIDHVKMRFRPSYFPFTEPSAELDIGCHFDGDTLRIGEGDDWLEILGCGMVHPKVIANCGIDPDEYQGFAFGCGIDRLAMLKYGMTDLRAFFESDLRWLRHYGFAALDIPTLAGGLSR